MEVFWQSSSNNQGVRVPKLRFPGFKGEWETSLLGEVGTFTKGAPLSKADISKDGTPFILYGELYTTYNEVTTAVVRKTDKEVESSQYSRIGDVIIPTSGETPEEIATATCVMLPNVILAGDLNIFRGSKVDGRIISYIVNHVVNRDISRIAQGKSVVHIKADELAKIRINYPHSEEQKKLVLFLEILSTRIEKQRQLIEALKSYKRGLLDAVFDGENSHIKIDRTTWQRYKIGDFLTPRIIKQIPTSESPLMAFTSEGGVCEKGERYDRSFLVKDDNKLYKRTELNDFIYSSNNLDVGSIGLNKYGNAVISDVYEIFTIHNSDICFMAEAICRPLTISKVLKYRQGVIYGQYRIYAEDFLGVDILLPPLGEQKRYSRIFSKMDEYITHEVSLLKNIEKTKLSLLQQLFI